MPRIVSRLPGRRRRGARGSGPHGEGRGRRIGWGLFDQGLSSLTNFGLAFVVAHFVSAKQFGAFTLVFAGYGLLLGASEGIASVPLAIRFSAVQGEPLRTATRESVGCALVIGIVSGLGCVAVS